MTEWWQLTECNCHCRFRWQLSNTLLLVTLKVEEDYYELKVVKAAVTTDTWEKAVDDVWLKVAFGRCFFHFRAIWFTINSTFIKLHTLNMRTKIKEHFVSHPILSASEVALFDPIVNQPDRVDHMMTLTINWMASIIWFIRSMMNFNSTSAKHALTRWALSNEFVFFQAT